MATKENARDRLPVPTEGPELFIGLVGASGTDLGLATDIICKLLNELNYTPIPIRLSELLSQWKKYKHLASPNIGTEDDRIWELMDAGDALRKELNRGDAVVLLAISAIRRHRRISTGNSEKPAQRHAYILRSLKTQEEVKTFRKVYGNNGFVFSYYSPRPDRLDRLSERIATSHHDATQADRFRHKAERIVIRDENDPNDVLGLGQDVQGTFPEADYFVHLQDRDRTSTQTFRFLQLIFGNEFITPTVDEYGMYHAKAAALRSADLARQVGSVITTDEGEIIAAGCNEVPKPGGGAPWENHIALGMYEDHRDFTKGFDFTAKIKLDIVAEIFSELQKEGWFSAKYKKMNPRSLAELALIEDEPKTKDSKTPPLKNTRVSSIIEFGRSVHAEMSAITAAARRGLSVQDQTLYCTTFPCHMCARHIISAGIRRVVFVEPYPKSMATDLYPEAITHEGREGDPESTKFDPFIGVSPKRYLDLFEIRKRKDGKGNVVHWSISDSVMRIASDWQTYFEVEKAYLEFLEESGLEIVGLEKRRRSRNR